MTAKHIYLELEDAPEGSKHVYDVLGLTAASTYDTQPPTNLKDQAYLRLIWCCNLVNKSVFPKTPENMGQYIQARQLVGGNASDFAFTKFAEGWCHRMDSPEQIDYKTIMNEQPLCEKMRDECPVATGPVGDGKTQPIIIPFNSSWKFMVSVNEVTDYEGNRRYAVFMKGAAERVFQRCGRYVKGTKFLPIDNKKAAHFIQTYNDFGKQGERLIGLP
jgi:magnesium-transporting ATPase (P-type)